MVTRTFFHYLILPVFLSNQSIRKQIRLGLKEHMADTSRDLEALMRHAQGGDGAAYSAVLKKSADLLRPYLRKWLKNNSEAEDVLQETLISVHKARHTYDGTRPYKPWLFAIAKFRLSDYWRRAYVDRLRTAVDLTEAENVSAQPVTNSGEAYEYLREGLKSLPPRQAEIIQLTHIDGYTLKEVALKLGMTEGAVKVAAHRAYKALRRKLEDE